MDFSTVIFAIVTCFPPLYLSANICNAKKS
uniref:Uncharacterized protein n=1 Tax=Rhizophora mucronata TaxID=61149 RepID=A0A2P2NCU7_RHIMU